MLVDIDVDIIKFRDSEDVTVIENSTDAIQEFFKLAESPLEEVRLTGAADGLIFGQGIEFEQLVTDLVSLSKREHSRFLGHDRWRCRLWNWAIII